MSTEIKLTPEQEALPLLERAALIRSQERAADMERRRKQEADDAASDRGYLARALKNSNVRGPYVEVENQPRMLVAEGWTFFRQTDSHSSRPDTMGVVVDCDCCGKALTVLHRFPPYTHDVAAALLELTETPTWNHPDQCPDCALKNAAQERQQEKEFAKEEQLATKSATPSDLFQVAVRELIREELNNHIDAYHQGQA